MTVKKEKKRKSTLNIRITYFWCHIHQKWSEVLVFLQVLTQWHLYYDILYRHLLYYRKQIQRLYSRVFFLFKSHEKTKSNKPHQSLMYRIPLCHRATFKNINEPPCYTGWHFHWSLLFSFLELLSRSRPCFINCFVLFSSTCFSLLEWL